MSGYWTILNITYPVFRIVIIFIGMILYILFWWLVDKTRVGAIIRAGMDDKEMTMGLGINLGLVTGLVFFFGTFITGIAGVIGMQIMGVNLGLPFTILQYSLVVVVIGGVGSVHGALLGSMIISFIDNFGKALFPQLSMFTIFLAMVIILLVRPVGLLGRKGF
jgi:branched-chain amino acid transport system permease protein